MSVLTFFYLRNPRVWRVPHVRGRVAFFYIVMSVLTFPYIRNSRVWRVPYVRERVEFFHIG